MRILFVCTGNAARSVMAATMARSRLEGHEISSAGTLSIEGRPMSQRTRTALARYGLNDRDHRSHQIGDEDLQWADLVVVFEPSHLSFIRRHHPAADAKTIALPRLVHLLSTESASRSVEQVMERYHSAQNETNDRNETIELYPLDEVIDPAGGDQPTFDRCATEISDLIDGLKTELERRLPDSAQPRNN